MPFFVTKVEKKEHFCKNSEKLYALLENISSIIGFEL